MKPVILDTGVLGRIAHPRMSPDVALWLRGLLAADVQVVVAEIADYELRRELLRAGKSKSLERLDRLKKTLLYLPLNTAMMLKAAELWAEARKMGLPTADPKELDGDAILAAQALALDAVVATDNVGHLARFADARRWKDIRT